MYITFFRKENVEDIILDDYPHELFSETYSRLNRKENKE